MLFPPPCRRAWVRGKAPWKCQGLGALPGVELCFPWLRVVDFIGSSQAGWFAERFFPLTPALSRRRGRTVRRVVADPERLDSSHRGMQCSLSLRERTRVRGNETQPTKTAGRILHAQLDRLFPDSATHPQTSSDIDFHRECPMMRECNYE